MSNIPNTPAARVPGVFFFYLPRRSGGLKADSGALTPISEVKHDAAP
ncbi:Hypothetical protein ETEE_2332 [Edwardsiella anguillarum ET080813]|uniref:Uncharacterized protein n=1 Tax=Edwardsiella anguillarum ET080813 TaxID=667120 RepID=A0A076LT47_9GAMM|nr:Hypothetical protein ETEE_2332 [Edwardsiella anguillarum ET080813]